MNHGKTIKLFLIDGDPNGRISCELSNWSGKLYKIPRAKLKDCSDRPEMQTTGIYLLLGKDEKDNDLVYIGETETILKRLDSHVKNKEFWNEVIVIISKDENLNKAHIKYIENKLHSTALKAGRYKVENSSNPRQSLLSESDRSEMEVFIENIHILVNILGHKIFNPAIEAEPDLLKNLFIIKSSGGANAKGLRTSEGFAVLKGSKAIFSEDATLPPHYLKLRNHLIDKGVIRIIDNSFEFEDDYVFSSASSAASIIRARSANGLVEWKLRNGTNLKTFESI